MKWLSYRRSAKMANENRNGGGVGGGVMAWLMKWRRLAKRQLSSAKWRNVAYSAKKPKQSHIWRKSAENLAIISQTKVIEKRLAVESIAESSAMASASSGVNSNITYEENINLNAKISAACRQMSLSMAHRSQLWRRHLAAGG
jgi:hypothetical protein